MGISTGGAVVTRYTAKYGQQKVTKLALIAAVTPLMIKREDYPDGVDPEAHLMKCRANLLDNRADFYGWILLRSFMVTTKLFNKKSEGVVQNFWRIAMQGSIKAHYDCIEAFSETDLREDLKQITDADFGALWNCRSKLYLQKFVVNFTLKLLKHGVEEQIKGASHGLCTTHKNEVSFALKQFFAAGSVLVKVHSSGKDSSIKKQP